MERGLPEGLVTSKENAPAVFEEFDKIYVEQVIFLWKGLCPIITSRSTMIADSLLA